VYVVVPPSSYVVVVPPPSSYSYVVVVVTPPSPSSAEGRRGGGHRRSSVRTAQTDCLSKEKLHAAETIRRSDRTLRFSLAVSLLSSFSEPLLDSLSWPAATSGAQIMVFGPQRRAAPAREDCEQGHEGPEREKRKLAARGARNLSPISSLWRPCWTASRGQRRRKVRCRWHAGLERCAAPVRP